MRSQRVLNANFLPLFGDAVVVFLLLTDGLCSCCTQFVPRFTYWPTSLHFLIPLLFPAHHTTTCSIFHALTYFLVSMQIRPFAGDWRLSVDSAHSLSRFFFCLQTDKQTHRQTRSNFSTPTFFCQLVSLNTNESFCFSLFSSSFSSLLSTPPPPHIFFAAFTYCFPHSTTERKCKTQISFYTRSIL